MTVPTLSTVETPIFNLLEKIMIHLLVVKLKEPACSRETKSIDLNRMVYRAYPLTPAYRQAGSPSPLPSPKRLRAGRHRGRGVNRVIF